MPFSNPIRTLLAGSLVLLLAACGGGGSIEVTNPSTPLAAPRSSTLAATSTSGVSSLPTATPAPAEQEAPDEQIAADTATPPVPATPEAPPPTPTPLPVGSIDFAPPQMPQGGWTIVYLTEEATSATLRFQERQYPMLHNGSYWWALVGVGAFTEPGLYAATVTYTPAGEEESISTTASVAVTARDFPIEEIELDETTASLLAPDTVQEELNIRSAIFSGFTAQRIWDGSFQAPAVGAISSIYGEGRSYNGGPVTDYHHGTDFIGDLGAPVYAAAAGQIAFTGELKVRGNAIVIDHGAGVFSAYHHLSAINVTEGQLVAAGEEIGAIGSTGLVTGPHLHWEVIIRGVEIDGELWLQAGEILP